MPSQSKLKMMNKKEFVRMRRLPNRFNTETYDGVNMEAIIEQSNQKPDLI